MSYYWTTQKGKMYICSLCNNISPSIVALKIDNVEVQFCGECWKSEYVTLAKSKDVELKPDEKVNENVELSGKQ